ncbi:MAG: cyclic nucleotide-binding domain-containing protein [Polyangiaceae bacterium]|nr:cyclic nucleotide-binding domain-containing protein [Polyangiaceae bacterium]
MVLPPVLPGSATVEEAPIDRALSLALANEREAALRWAAAIVRHDPAMPTALCLTGRLLGELGRQEKGREACAIAIERALDLENLPLAVAAAREIERLGGDPGPHLDRIAAAFCKDSPRLGPGVPPPPPLPTAEPFQPLHAVLTGALLANKATEIVHEARRRFEAEPVRPGIAAQPIFSSIGEAALRALAGALTPLWVRQGTRVIEQGSTGGEAYFVARGELEAVRERAGETIVVERLANGALFGEAALLSRAPRSEGVVATRPSILLEIKRAALDGLADLHPEVGVELAEHCRARMVDGLARTSEVLRAVPDGDRPALMRRFVTRAFEKGDRLLHQDERPPGLYMIASGEAAVVRRDAEGGEPLVLGALGPGDVTGEVALVLRRPANADVIATHPTVALYLPAEQLLGLAHDHPAALAKLYELAVRRDEETRTILEEEVSVAEDFVLV